MSSTTTSRSGAAVNESELCQFPFKDGRRCRTLRHPGHSCLCIFHARAESQLVETERLGIELGETLSGDSVTATDINRAMGRPIPPSRRTASPSAMPTPSPASAAPCSAPSPPSKPNSNLNTASTSEKRCCKSPSRPPHPALRTLALSAHPVWPNPLRHRPLTQILPTRQSPSNPAPPHPPTQRNSPPLTPTKNPHHANPHANANRAAHPYPSFPTEWPTFSSSFAPEKASACREKSLVPIFVIPSEVCAARNLLRLCAFDCGLSTGSALRRH